MNVKNILMIVLALIYTSSYAQDRDRVSEKRKEIEAKKVAFITERLSLTPEEAQKFWPIYNQHQEGLKTMMKDARSTKRGEDLSEEDARNLVESRLENEKKRLAMKEKMVSDLDAFLSMKKINDLFIAEHAFKKEVLDQFRHRHRRGKKKSQEKP